MGTAEPHESSHQETACWRHREGLSHRDIRVHYLKSTETSNREKGRMGDRPILKRFSKAKKTGTCCLGGPANLPSDNLATPGTIPKPDG